MFHNDKFKFVEPANIDVNIRDEDDHKFYQTAYNTEDRIFITQEDKLLAKRNEVYGDLSIKTLRVGEANTIVITEGPVEFDNFSEE